MSPADLHVILCRLLELVSLLLIFWLIINQDHSPMLEIVEANFIEHFRIESIHGIKFTLEQNVIGLIELV